MKPQAVRTLLIIVVVVVAAGVLFVVSRRDSAPMGGASLTPEQKSAVEGLVRSADAIAASLAADNLNDYNAKAKEVAPRAAAAEQAIGEEHPWQDEIQHAAEHSKLPEAGTLEEARKAFLPFSEAVVDLAREARLNPGFKDIKIYKCPMVDEAWEGAPKNGLWVQVQGGLRNPYFGKRMLECGVEVR